MHLGTMIDRIDKLTVAELRHARSLVTVEVQNYRRATENYTPMQMEKYGHPHMKMFEEWASKLDAALAARGEKTR